MTPLLLLLLQVLTIQLHFIQPGVSCKGPNGQEARCYYLPEYKQLLEMDDALFTARAKEGELKLALDDQNQIIELWSQEMKTFQEDNDILTERSERLKAELEAEQNKFPVAGFVGGTVLGLAVGALAVGAIWAYQAELAR